MGWRFRQYQRRKRESRAVTGNFAGMTSIKDTSTGQTFANDQIPASWTNHLCPSRLGFAAQQPRRAFLWSGPTERSGAGDTFEPVRNLI